MAQQLRDRHLVTQPGFSNEGTWVVPIGAELHVLAEDVLRRLYPDTDNAGLPLTYVIGWILVPNYMRTQINFFVPWSAIDVTHAKTATGAQGVFYLEATLDGNNHVHPVSIAHLYTSENLFGYGVMHAHSLAAYEPVSDNDSHPLLAPGRVVCGDGNVAIPTALGDFAEFARRSFQPTCHRGEWPQRAIDCIHTGNATFCLRPSSNPS